MAMLDGIKRQLRSVIEWNHPDPDILFYQWTENGDEIKNASNLIVGPGQGCIFVYEGQVQSVIDQECMVNLKTENIPFWTTITKFMQFFESEHKVGIYFYRKAKFLDQKWGTTSPIVYEDPKYRFPVSLMAYGNYSYQIEDANHFFINVIGSQSVYSADDFRRVMSARILQPITDYLAESQLTYTEIDSKRDEIAQGISIKLSMVFRKLGFDITDFRIEGTQFDADTMERINRIAEVSTETMAAKAAGLNYSQLQNLEAMREAARNEGGAAGIGLGIGAGMGFGKNMADAMDTPSNTQSSSSNTEKLTELKQLFEADLITESEYQNKKKEILDRF